MQSVREAFIAAPLTDGGWDIALRDMARLTNSARGQLVAFDGGPVFAMDIITDLEDESHHARFAEISGSDPDVNWRVRCTGAPLEVISEHHYAQARRDRRYDAYDDFIGGADMMNGCQTALIMEKNSFFGLATLRTEADGRSSESDLAGFEAVASAAQTGVQLQRTLAHQGALLVRGALEAMDAAALLLDRRGNIVGQTASAERCLARQEHVKANGRRLFACSPRSDRALQAAIGGALRQDGFMPQRVWLRSRDSAAPGLGCEIFALPRHDWNFGALPHVLVALRERPAFGESEVGLLREAMGFSQSEAEVALLLAQGRTREDIALQRNVGYETVAAQVKALYRKSDVNHSGALIALIRDML